MPAWPSAMAPALILLHLAARLVQRWREPRLSLEPLPMAVREAVEGELGLRRPGPLQLLLEHLVLLLATAGLSAWLPSAGLWKYLGPTLGLLALLAYAVKRPLPSFWTTLERLERDWRSADGVRVLAQNGRQSRADDDHLTHFLLERLASRPPYQPGRVRPLPLLLVNMGLLVLLLSGLGLLRLPQALPNGTAGLDLPDASLERGPRILPPGLEAVSPTPDPPLATRIAANPVPQETPAPPDAPSGGRGIPPSPAPDRDVLQPPSGRPDAQTVQPPPASPSMPTGKQSGLKLPPLSRQELPRWLDTRETP